MAPVAARPAISAPRGSFLERLENCMITLYSSLIVMCFLKRKQNTGQWKNANIATKNQ
jgi:hypothetical protein